MNEIQEEILELSSELQNGRQAKIESRTYCPWCGEFSLILREHNYSYICLDCGRNGGIAEVKHEYYGKMMSKPRGVKI